MIGYYEQPLLNSNAPIDVRKSYDLTFVAHMHVQYEFFYIMSGSTKMTIDGKHYALEKGDCCLVLSNQVHSYKCESCTAYLTIFEPSTAYNFSLMIKKKEFESPVFHLADKQDEVISCLEKMENELKSNGNLLTVVGYLNLILGLIMDNAKLIPVSGNTHTSLQKVISYVSENYNSSLSLDDVSRDVNLSKYHISRLFNKYIGTSFTGYVKYLRINQAQNLLIETNLSIADIAYECGFENIRSFNRSFLEICGNTPREYRAQNT